MGLTEGGSSLADAFWLTVNWQITLNLFGFLQKKWRLLALVFRPGRSIHVFFQLSEICSVFVLIVNHTFWCCMMSREYHILWAICMKPFIMLLYPCCCFCFFFSSMFAHSLSFVLFVVRSFPVLSFLFSFPHTPQPGVADSCLSESKLKGSSSFPLSPIAHL